MSAHHYFREFSYCDSGMVPWLAGAGADLHQRQVPLGRAGRRPRRAFSRERRDQPASRRPGRRHSTRVRSSLRAPDAFEGSTRRTAWGSSSTTWRFNLRLSNTEPLIRLERRERGGSRADGARRPAKCWRCSTSRAVMPDRHDIMTSLTEETSSCSSSSENGQPIFIGFKLDGSAAPSARVAVSGPDKQVRVRARTRLPPDLPARRGSRYVGKLIHERLTTERVDDITPRNMLQHHAAGCAPDTRLTESARDPGLPWSRNSRHGLKEEERTARRGGSGSATGIRTPV